MSWKNDVHKKDQGKLCPNLVVSKQILVLLVLSMVMLFLFGCSKKVESTEPAPLESSSGVEVQTSGAENQISDAENQSTISTEVTPVNSNENLPEILKGKTINITDDGSEWPPYTYYERVNGQPTENLVGFSVDVIKEIFDKNGIPYMIKLLPWKRAQEEVENGETYQMFLSGSYSEERANNYYLSKPYYSISGYYFYSKKTHPSGLKINSLVDLKNFKVAGLLGHNYEAYGFKSDEIDTGAKTYTNIVKQLHRGYYDLFPESLEILTGYSKISEDILADPDLGYARVPGMDSVEFYMMFTKNETGEALKRIVDAGLEEMQNSGRLSELLKLYMP